MKKHVLFTIPIVLALCISTPNTIFSANEQGKTSTVSTQAITSKQNKAITKAYQDFLAKHQNNINYFRIDTIAGEKTPLLFVTDSVFDDGVTTSATLYIAKPNNKQATSYSIKKIGEAESTSSSYPLVLNKKKLVFGSHHYIGNLYMKQGNLYCDYYHSTSDKKGNETFYHTLYKNNKKLSEKQISKKTGETYLYNNDNWSTNNMYSFTFQKNTKANRTSI